MFAQQPCASGKAAHPAGLKGIFPPLYARLVPGMDKDIQLHASDIRVVSLATIYGCFNRPIYIYIHLRQCIYLCIFACWTCICLIIIFQQLFLYIIAIHIHVCIGLFSNNSNSIMNHVFCKVAVKIYTYI